MDPQTMTQMQAQHILATMLPIIAIVVVLFYALQIVPLWIALKKAGLAGPLALITLVPTLGLIIVLFILAFARWRVVPAPEYAYSPQMPLGYPPAFAHAQAPPPVTGYNAPGAYASTPQAYPPPQAPSTDL